MIKACESLAIEQATPAEYAAFIRDYRRKCCCRWER